MRGGQMSPNIPDEDVHLSMVADTVLPTKVCRA